MNKAKIMQIINLAFIQGYDIELCISHGKTKIAFDLINHPNFKQSVLYPTIGHTHDTQEDYETMLKELAKQHYKELDFTSATLLKTRKETLEFLEALEAKGFKIELEV